MTISGQFPTIPDHNTVRSADNRLCFSQEWPVIYRNFSGIIFEQNIYDNSWSIPDNSWPQHSPPCGQQWLFMNANFRKFSVNWNKKFTSISGQFMAIYVDPNKSARRTTSRLCFSQECPVIYRNFSGIIFLTIPGLFPTIPDHNTVRSVRLLPKQSSNSWWYFM